MIFGLQWDNNKLTDASKTLPMFAHDFPASKERMLAESMIGDIVINQEATQDACPNAAACGALAEEYLRGTNGKPRLVLKGRNMLRGACVKGHGPSCALAGRLAQLDGEPVENALLWYKKGCDASDPTSCTSWSRWSVGLPVNTPTVPNVAAMKSMCDSDPRFCAAYGVLRSEDFLTSKGDAAAALAGYRAACNAKVDEGCALLAIMLHNNGDNAAGLAVLKDQCAVDGRYTCAWGAALAKSDPAVARGFREQACARGDIGACTVIAVDEVESKVPATQASGAGYAHRPLHD